MNLLQIVQENYTMMMEQLQMLLKKALMNYCILNQPKKGNTSSLKLILKLERITNQKKKKLN